MKNDLVYVWVIGKGKKRRYAQWSQSEPTADVKRATYYDDKREAEKDGEYVASKGYRLIQIPRPIKRSA